jgi:hypothetical protein
MVFQKLETIGSTNIIARVTNPGLGRTIPHFDWKHTTQEKRLMVDLVCLQQSYERREIAEDKWIDGNNTPADAMAKSKPCRALKDLIDRNTIKLEVTEWVERAENAGGEKA